MRHQTSFGRAAASLALVAMLCVSAVAAPVVGNVRMLPRRDRAGRVDIYYDVAGASNKMIVSIVGSSDKGKTWSVLPNPNLMSGDVGAGVRSGTGKHIVWDAGADRPGVYAPQNKYRIVADEIGGEIVHTLPGNIRLEMARIPAGTFLMGTTRESSPSTEAERPAHVVSVKSFHIGKYPVTQRQWKAVMGENPSRQQGDDYPVEQVSWDDCKKFVDSLNTLGKGTFRLPSEAEWEFACRGGTKTRWFFGDAPTSLTAYAWCSENSVVRNRYITHPVGQKLANPFGLHDMIGNAWEWCEDDWHSLYRNAPIDGSAWIDKPARGMYRALRGGGYSPGPLEARPAYRFYTAPDYKDSYSGLRLAWTP